VGAVPDSRRWLGAPGGIWRLLEGQLGGALPLCGRARRGRQQKGSECARAYRANQSSFIAFLCTPRRRTGRAPNSFHWVDLRSRLHTLAQHCRGHGGWQRLAASAAAVPRRRGPPCWGAPLRPAIERRVHCAAARRARRARCRGQPPRQRSRDAQRQRCLRGRWRQQPARPPRREEQHPGSVGRPPGHCAASAARTAAAAAPAPPAARRWRRRRRRRRGPRRG
jgi:hypothetical protein